MFGRLFGRKKDPEPDGAADEAFDKAKQEALERSLGPMDDMVLHSVIPFFLGGGLDLYTFSRSISGTVYATQELISRERSNRTKAGKMGHFELVACRKAPDPDGESEGTRLVSAILNPIARYASMARLSPLETAELPVEEGEPSQPVLFDRFDPKSVPFEFNGERFGLLLCMTLHHSELAHARSSGSKGLIERLKAAGAYPYSTPDREAVA